MIRIHLMGIALLTVYIIFPIYIFSQNQTEGSITIPEALLRPVRGEAPRYPRDTVIGELGQGAAPERAWRYARNIGAFLVARNQNSSAIAGDDNYALREYFPAFESFEPRRYHLGGGRIEADGSVSFLLRFLGREQWMAGELYLRLVEDNWRLDDLILEEVRGFEEGKSSYSYDFSPYERFF